MAWSIEFDPSAKKELAKLDKAVARRILVFLKERVAPSQDPCSIGEVLKGPKFGEFWKYRVGDYRVVCRIEDGRLTVLVVRIGNRREVYR